MFTQFRYAPSLCGPTWVVGNATSDDIIILIITVISVRSQQLRWCVLSLLAISLAIISQAATIIIVVVTIIILIGSHNHRQICLLSKRTLRALHANTNRTCSGGGDGGASKRTHKHTGTKRNETKKSRNLLPLAAAAAAALAARTAESRRAAARGARMCEPRIGRPQLRRAAEREAAARKPERGVTHPARAASSATDGRGSAPPVRLLSSGGASDAQLRLAKNLCLLPSSSRAHKQCGGGGRSSKGSFANSRAHRKERANSLDMDLLVRWRAAGSLG